MKLSLVFVGAVFGEQCYEGLFNQARAIERAASANVAEALVDFGDCVERDMNLQNFNEVVLGGPPEGCIKSFLERCYACIPIQEDHPFCKEDSPHFNGFMCALKLNQCLIESLSGIADDCTRN